MTDFSFIKGDLLVEKSAKEDERLEDGENRYSRAMFQSENVNFMFQLSIGGYFPVKERSFETVNNKRVYYPYRNETSVELQFSPQSSNFEVLEENIHVEVVSVGSDLYIRSQNEVTAYGGTYVIVDNNLYEIVPSLLMGPRGPFEGDEFLGIEEESEPVRIENLSSGYSTPVSYDRVAEIVENENKNGALKVREPENALSNLIKEINDG